MQQKLLKNNNKERFKRKKIKYLRIKDNALWIKYSGFREEFLTDGKIDFDEYWETQHPFIMRAQAKMLRKAKTWKKRHQRFLNMVKKQNE